MPPQLNASVPATAVGWLCSWRAELRASTPCPGSAEPAHHARHPQPQDNGGSDRIDYYFACVDVARVLGVGAVQTPVQQLPACTPPPHCHVRQHQLSAPNCGAWESGCAGRFGSCKCWGGHTQFVLGEWRRTPLLVKAS